VDILARGIIRALEDLRVDLSTFPVVVREAGVNDAAARELFTAAGVEYYGDEVTMTEACTHMITRMQKNLADRRPG
jgi:succinyl-CoA synthetase beta subunit/citryl-CoA synthetase large subunit